MRKNLLLRNKRKYILGKVNIIYKSRGVSHLTYLGLSEQTYMQNVFGEEAPKKWDKSLDGGQRPRVLSFGAFSCV